MTFSKEDTKAVKGAAILLMLYHHLFAYPERIAEEISYIACFSIDGNTSAYWVGLFGKLCVALFFFLGGYGTFSSANRSEDLTKTIWNKIKHLYTAYWKVFLIFIPISVLCNVHTVEKNLASLIRNFTGLNITYNYEWWFFTPYLLITVSYPAIHRMLKQKSSVFTDLLAVLLWSVLIINVVPRIYSYTWASSLKESFFWSIFSAMLPNSPVFLMGCIFAKHNLLDKIKQQFSGQLSSFLAGSIILLLIFYMRKQSPPTYDLVFAPLFTAALITILSLRPCKVIYSILNKVGQESTTIWLVHSFYCYHLCQRFIFMPRYTPLIFALLLIVTYVTAIALRKFYKLLFIVYRLLFKEKMSARIS